MAKIAINGFGRIGRPALKVALTKANLEVVAINDLTDVETLAHLLKYDSTYGIYNHKINTAEGKIIVDDKEIKVLAEKDPAQLPWKELGVDIVLECTGIFCEYDQAALHLQAGAKKVIISAPAKGEKAIPTFVPGVNADSYDAQNHDIVSCASCTTNCLAPVASVLHDNFQIEKGLMTTIHSYTNDQRLLDLPHKDVRRARAAALNIIPTTTGAAKAIGLVIPELDGCLDGMALRVPTAVVSVVDLVCQLTKETNKEDVDKVFIEAAKSAKYKGILGVSLEQLTSMDYRGNSFSAIVDLPLTQVIGGRMVKIMAWYDNEWGYTNRLVEMAELISAKI